MTFLITDMGITEGCGANPDHPVKSCHNLGVKRLIYMQNIICRMIRTKVSELHTCARARNKSPITKNINNIYSNSITFILIILFIYKSLEYKEKKQDKQQDNAKTNRISLKTDKQLGIPPCLTLSAAIGYASPVAAKSATGFSSSNLHGGYRHQQHQGGIFVSKAWLALIDLGGCVGGLEPAGCLVTGLLTRTVALFAFSSATGVNPITRSTAMRHAKVVSLELHRPLTPVKNLRSQKEKLKRLLADYMPVAQPDQILDDLKAAIERAADRRVQAFGERLSAIEQQLTLLTNQGENHVDR